MQAHRWSLCTLAMLLGALVGCQSVPSTPTKSTSAKPEWIVQPPLRADMAYGVGSMEIYGSVSDAVQRASELARADLVSQLRVTVSAEFSLEQRQHSSNNSPASVDQSVRHYVRSKIPNATLDEVRIVDSYEDGRYAYALAELDRAQAAVRLRRQIGDVELALAPYAQISPSGTTLERLQALLPALSEFAKRDALVEQLQLVSPERRGQALPDSLQALQQRIHDLLRQLRVALVLNNQGAREVGAGVLEGLTQQGLRVSDAQTADVVFEVSAELTRTQQGKSHYVFADSRVTVRDGQGRALSSFSKQARGVSGLPDVARQTAARNVAKLLSEELAVTLVDKLK